ncbi:hypothetical protein D3C87_1875380 [compost metagenome]
MQQGQPPDDHRTPVVADKGRILVSVVIEERDEIACQMFDIILRHLSRTGRVTIAPLVWNDDVVACCDKGRHLMAPGIGMLRPAVT